MVKIIAASDLHGIVNFPDVAQFAIDRGADIVVVAGDVQTAFLDITPEWDFKTIFLLGVQMLREYGIDVVLVPGNHDFYLRDIVGGGRLPMDPNLHILCDKEETIKGLKFYGTPWVPTINGRWAYELNEDELKDKFSNIPEGIDVLVSHTPPRGENGMDIDVSLQKSFSQHRHFGSSSLRMEIEVKKPKVVICGHIHTGFHHPKVIEASAVLNVSLVDELYRKAYKPAEIQFCNKGKIKARANGGRKWTTIRK